MHTLPSKLKESIFDAIAENDGIKFARLLKENEQFTHNLINEEALFSIKDYLDDKSILQGLPYDYLTLAHIIAFFDSLECLIALYKITDDLLKKSIDEFSPLHYAVVGSSIECASFLIKFVNADVNEEVQGRTPLYFAICSNNIDMVKLLFNFNAKLPNSTANKKYSPIYQALRNQNMEILMLLLEKLSDGNHTENSIFSSYIPPLLQAVSLDLDDAILPLLQHGCDPNAASSSGERPLLLAIRKGKQEIVNNLLHYGANISLRGIRGAAAIHYAVESGSLKMINIMIGRGAILTTTDERKQIPTFYALHLQDVNNAIQILSFLFERGLDINAFDKNNDTILSLALQEPRFLNTKFIQYLLDNDANPLSHIKFPVHDSKPISILSAVLDDIISAPNEIKILLKEYANKRMTAINEQTNNDNQTKAPGSTVHLNLSNLNLHNFKLTFKLSHNETSTQKPQVQSSIPQQKSVQPKPSLQPSLQQTFRPTVVSAPISSSGSDNLPMLPVNPISLCATQFKAASQQTPQTKNSQTPRNYLEEFLRKMDKTEEEKKKDQKKK